MKFGLKETGKLLKQTAAKWWQREPFRASASIAYYAIFSLPGLMVVILSLAGYFFDANAVNERVNTQIAEAMGKDTADQVDNMISKASESKDSIWATAFGIFVIFIGATGVFAELQKALNTIWEVKPDEKKSGIVIFLRSRLFSFGLIVSIAFLLLISLVVSSALTAMSDYMRTHWPEGISFLFGSINFIFSLLVIMALFALMFKILPDAKIRWSSVWVGSFFTGLMFVIGKTLLGLYFGKAEPGSGYGAAGSVVLIMLWTSYSSMIVFFGAEFTKAYSDYHFGEAPPVSFAVKKKGSKA